MKDRISISISILAIIISGVSLYFSNSQRPDIDFNCGVEIEVYKSMEGSTDKDLLIPFSFVNKSNQAGSIMQIKLNICPFINKIQLSETLCNRDFLWTGIWKTSYETINDSLKTKGLTDHLFDQPHIITLTGNSANYQLINFFPINSNFSLQKENTI